MRKAFGFILMVVLVMSLMGCEQGKATTTENNSTEVKTEATTKENPTTEATVTDATVTDATVIDATVIDATVTDATKTDASFNDETKIEATSSDAKSASASDGMAENVVVTENVDYGKALDEIIANPDKKIMVGNYGNKRFKVYIADNGSDDIDVYLNEHQDDFEIYLLFNKGIVEKFSDETTESNQFDVRIVDGVAQFSVTFKDGKTVNVAVHVPEA